MFRIVPGSIAEKKGIKTGDKLHTVNGNEIRDVLDYRFYLADRKAELSLERDGVFYNVAIQKEMYADIGLEFETYLMDEKHSCRNRCIFCFIDQLPKGMRESLYFKDDDSRLSFLMGNYITLTNLSDYDIQRIIKMRISPVNVSVHTMNPSLRISMMKNKRAGETLKYLKELADSGIELNCQIVLCKGINDGDELEYSMIELEKLYPSVVSVSIVPAGMTRYRENLFPLEAFSEDDCAEIIRQVTRFGDRCVKEHGSRIFYCGDEFYVKSGIQLPDDDFYEGYPQIENGVGMLTSMKTEFDIAAENIHNTDPRKRTVSVATGCAAYDFIRELAVKATAVSEGLTVNVYKIINNFFGKSITVAGLLTGKDIYEQLLPYSQSGRLGEKLLLPRVMLRAEGDLFLDGMTPQELSESLNIKIEFADSDGEDFLRKVIN